MNNTLIFVGYGSGTKKADKKPYCFVKFITVPTATKEQDACYCDMYTVFTQDIDKYNKFIKEHGINDKVAVNFEVIGGQVRYYI